MGRDFEEPGSSGADAYGWGTVSSEIIQSEIGVLRSHTLLRDASPQAARAKNDSSAGNGKGAFQPSPLGGVGSGASSAYHSSSSHLPLIIELEGHNNKASALTNECRLRGHRSGAVTVIISG
jgi:hypothetical protein